MHKIFGFAAVLLWISTSGSIAQVMSTNKTANPTTQGYATAGSALKDQHSTGKKGDTRRSKTTTAKAPAGTTPAETAGASSPNGQPKARGVQ